MIFEKYEEYGTFYDDQNVIHALWFSDESIARDDIKIRAVLAIEDSLKGRTTSIEDYAAATTGLGTIKPCNAPFGGFVLYFPSQLT